MKKACLVLAVISFLASPYLIAMEGRFMSYPDIQGDRIVFTYESDLWLADVKDGTAARLTSFPGNEYAAKFSPDGAWIAFSAEYDGTESVYRMPVEGGTPERLTCHPGRARVITWTRDGRYVVYRSFLGRGLGRDPFLYRVGIQGTAPEKLPVPRGVLCSFSPGGQQMVYNRRGREDYYWKRYKGGMYQDIWSYDFQTREFTKLTDYIGKNAYPMWIGEAVYFISDRDGGISNLYRSRLDGSSVETLTRYEDFDVMWPSTDGERIVYVQSGYLHVLDMAEGTSKKVVIRLLSDRWQLAERVINPKKYIHYMAVSGDGETAVLEARGDIYMIMEDGKTRNLSSDCGSREMYPELSPDGKYVAFFSDRTGDYQLYIQPAEGGEWIRLTDGLRDFVYHPVWSPDSRKILFGNKNFEIYYIDIENRKPVLVDKSNQLKNDEFFWEISDYAWAPDSQWIAYSLVSFNRNSRIFLYNLKAAKRYPVTDDFYDNFNPGFDAGGDYLFFLSNRNYKIRMDFTEGNHIIENPTTVMCVQLRSGEKPPFSDDAEEEEERESETASEEETFRIDIEGIEKRVYPLPADPGNFFFLRAGDGIVAWASVPAFKADEYDEIFNAKGDNKWTLHLFDIAEAKEVALEETMRDYRLSPNGQYLIIHGDEDYAITSLETAWETKDHGEAISLEGMTYRVEPLREWTQIFDDCWRLYRDFFYDPGFHGKDWKTMGKQYRALLPDISSRAQLNWLLLQMVGELCVSHTYVFGGDTEPLELPESPVQPGLLGADLVADGGPYYRIEKIYGPTEFNADIRGPLVRPDIAMEEGAFLIRIDGREIHPPYDYYRYLQVTEDQEISITVNNKPAPEGAVTYTVQPVSYRDERALRYEGWLALNIRKTLEESNGTIGYMHINAMGGDRGVMEFDKFWRAFRYKKGLIIDVRRNSGGWTEYFLIDKLERQMVAYNVLKGMVPFRYPGTASSAHYAVVTNEDNGSDGECFVQHFRARHLGTVIGVPSWGGLVGIINGQKTVDNGTIYQSNNAFYGRESEWWVENHGADPDIYVENDPASVMAGRDPQLEKAIGVLLEKIKNKPFEFPPAPPIEPR